ncbi:MAG TPA: hypothetical protein VLH12_08415 [Usitatibacter sp.]|nr:hypothetical protein [Usitatibacter sp.]
MDLDLSTFIRRLGVPEAAKLFGVSEHTAKSWLYGERRPRPETALKIVEATASHPVGTVSLAGCFSVPEGRAQ